MYARLWLALCTEVAGGKLADLLPRVRLHGQLWAPGQLTLAAGVARGQYWALQAAYARSEV